MQEKAGRSEWIRTTGPYVPNVVLYQAELHSDEGAYSAATQRSQGMGRSRDRYVDEMHEIRGRRTSGLVATVDAEIDEFQERLLFLGIWENAERVLGLRAIVAGAFHRVGERVIPLH